MRGLEEGADDYLTKALPTSTSYSRACAALLRRRRRWDGVEPTTGSHCRDVVVGDEQSSDFDRFSIETRNETVDADDARGRLAARAGGS